MPTFARLRDPELLARIRTIRAAVRPILAINNLPHFTDHSVDHSDRVCRYIDELTTPLQRSGDGLADVEAFVLYGASYLHDIGMQHQRAGDTDVIRQVLARTHGEKKKATISTRQDESEPHFVPQHWNDLSIDTKRNLLRVHHHRVSAEMVRASIDVANPILGQALYDRDYPGYIASLCEAHCIEPDDHHYLELVQDGPSLRMQLLSALLRIADILDESRRRTQMHLEQTVDLDATSRMHWWRHYYVEDVKFNASDQRLTIWFDFPVDRRDEYRRLIPELQLPYLQREFEYHRLVLGKAGLFWALDTQETSTTSSVAKVMPDEVHLRMVSELAAKHNRDVQADRITVLRHLQENRPVVERSLCELRDNEQKLPSDEYLRRAVELAIQLRDIGGRRDAWVILRGEHERMKSRASTKSLLETGCVLCEMMLCDDASEMALHELQSLEGIADTLARHDPLRISWLRLYAAALVEQCAYVEAVKRMIDLTNLLPAGYERESWRARLVEIHFFQGELDAVSDLLLQENQA